MDTSSTAAGTLLETLKKRKILTLEELCEIAKRSPMTVWRILKPAGYYTSFNHNGRYYTLAETPRFDVDGLWYCREVGFSRLGTLNATLVAMVHKAKMGMTPNELSEVLRVRVQNQMYHLFARRQVDRTAWGRAHVYLSIEERVRKEQLRRREASRKETLPSAPGETSLGETETIAILAEMVRAPRSSARRIAAILRSRGFDATREKVLAVTEKYNLLKKGRYRRSRP